MTRPVAAGEWGVPGRVVLDDDVIRWELYDETWQLVPGSEWISTPPQLLEDFIELGDASPGDVARFVARCGPLEVPRGPLPPVGEWVDRVENWRACAVQAHRVVELVAQNEHREAGFIASAWQDWAQVGPGGLTSRWDHFAERWWPPVLQWEPK